MTFGKYPVLAGIVAMAFSAGVSAEVADGSSNQTADRGRISSGWESSQPVPSAGPADDQEYSGRSAAAGTTVPEPSNLLMLGLGVAGLIAGRLVARRRKKS